MFASGLGLIPAVLWTAVVTLATRGALVSHLDAGAAAGPFAGILVAAQAAVAAGGNRRAGLAELVRSLSLGAWLPAASLIAAALAAAILTLAPLPVLLAALSWQHPGIAPTGIAPYLLTVFPSALVGAGLGSLAGAAFGEAWLAVLVALGGCGLALWLAGRAGSLLVPGPLGVVALGALAPLTGPAWGAWPLLTMTSLQALLWTGLGCLPAAAVLPPSAPRLRLLLLALAVAGGGGATAGNALALGTLAQGRAPGALAPQLRIVAMDATMRLGDRSVVAGRATIENSGDRALPLTRLPLPAGLTAISMEATTIPPHGVRQVGFVYGGRWTRLGAGAGGGLVTRAATPERVLLTPGSGWLPPGSYPVTLRFAGAVPPGLWCSLAAGAGGLWTGSSGSATCLGGRYEPTTVGQMEVFGWDVPPGRVAELNSFAAGAATCAGAGERPLDLVAEPAVAAALPPDVLLHGATASGDVIAVDHVLPADLVHTPSVLLPLAGAVWSGGAALPPDPSGWRRSLVAALALVTARAQGLRVDGLSLSALPALQAAWAAHSTAYACAALARLRADDLQGLLTAATVASILGPTAAPSQPGQPGQ